MKFTSLLLIALISSSVLFAQKNDSIDLLIENFEKKLNETPEPQILDLRSPEEFSLNHIKGAVNIEIQDEDIERQLETLQKDKPVFVYSIRNNRSSIMAAQLKQRGFSQVYELPGGIAAWIGLGKPIEGAKKIGLSKSEFYQQVQKEGFVLVEFGTKYCGACKKQSIIIDSLQHENGLTTRMIDIYEHQQLAKELGITAIPALYLYKDGKLSWQHTGLLQKELLAAAILKQKEAIVQSK